MDKIDEKTSFFWNMSLTASIAYAPPADHDEKGPQNILIDYPNQTEYRSKVIPPDEKLEIVLDLGRTFELSRLKIVWADDLVPESWFIDTSVDGQSWRPWINQTNIDINNHSWWPGYEHYGNEIVQARFVKYRPLSRERWIRLRCLTLQR